MKKYIPLANSFGIDSQLTDEKIKSFTDCTTQEFEAVLKKKFFPNRRVCLLNSGTAAIHLALKLLDVGIGDSILCQTATYVATMNPILYQGAYPILIDSEKFTNNISPIFLEEAIVSEINEGRKPKAIIAVHLYGMPYDVDAIQKISRKYEIPVIEDSAEALGSKFNDKFCGSFGDVSILSFNNNKILSTLGGGAVIVNTDEDYKKCKFWSTHSREKSAYYHHKEIGYNYKISPMAGFLGLNQIEDFSKKLESKIDMRNWYSEIFQNFPHFKIQNNIESKYSSNFWLSVLLVDNQNFYQYIDLLYNAFKEENIESRYGWKPMHMQPLCNSFKFFGNNNSELFFNSSLCLPSSTNLSSEDLKRIEMVILRVLKK